MKCILPKIWLYIFRLITTRCDCGLLNKIGPAEFDIPKNVLDLVYAQILCWYVYLFFSKEYISASKIIVIHCILFFSFFFFYFPLKHTQRLKHSRKI